MSIKSIFWVKGNIFGNKGKNTLLDEYVFLQVISLL